MKNTYHMDLPLRWIAMVQKNLNAFFVEKF